MVRPRPRIVISFFAHQFFYDGVESMFDKLMFVRTLHFIAIQSTTYHFKIKTSVFMPYGCIQSLLNMPKSKFLVIRKLAASL